MLLSIWLAATFINGYIKVFIFVICTKKYRSTDIQTRLNSCNTPCWRDILLNKQINLMEVYTNAKISHFVAAIISKRNATSTFSK